MNQCSVLNFYDMNNNQKTKHKHAADVHKTVYRILSPFSSIARQEVLLNIRLYATIPQTHDIRWPLQTTPHHDCLLMP